MCPAHMTNTAVWRSSWIKFSSYVMTGGDQRGLWLSLGRWSGRKTYKASMFKPLTCCSGSLTQRVMAVTSTSNDAASEPKEGLTKRHGEGAVIGIMDGHVEFIRWEKYFKYVYDLNKKQSVVLPGIG